MPGPARRSESKRNDPTHWRPATLFLRTERKAALERFIHLAKLDGDVTLPADQSELVDRALEAWLYVALPPLERRVIGTAQEGR